MKDKQARKEIEKLVEELNKLKSALSSHRHELGNGDVYVEYV